jgi:hypothetical protein
MSDNDQKMAAVESTEELNKLLKKIINHPDFGVILAQKLQVYMGREGRAALAVALRPHVAAITSHLKPQLMASLPSSQQVEEPLGASIKKATAATLGRKPSSDVKMATTSRVGSSGPTAEIIDTTDDDSLPIGVPTSVKKAKTEIDTAHEDLQAKRNEKRMWTLTSTFPKALEEDIKGISRYKRPEFYHQIVGHAKRYPRHDAKDKMVAYVKDFIADYDKELDSDALKWINNAKLKDSSQQFALTSIAEALKD